MNNNIDKNIFNSYEMVEAALLNDLATEVHTKGKKARTLKGENFYLRFNSMTVAVTPEQYRIYKLIRNNYDAFRGGLKTMKNDYLRGFGETVLGDRVSDIIARKEKGLEICQKYFDALKAFIIEAEESGEKAEVEEKKDEEKTEGETVEKNEETEEKTEKMEAEVTEAIETSNDKREAPVVEYKLIEGFEEYMVSSDGKVWSLNYGRTGKMKELKPQTDKGGYLQVGLWSNGQCVRKLVHRLVAEAFIANPDSKLQVNHIDEMKSNNCADNLEWCDAKYNSNFGSRNERVAKARINHPDRSKPVLCVETGVAYPSVSEASRQTGIKQQSISACINGKRKTAGGYHWRAVR